MDEVELKVELEAFELLLTTSELVEDEFKDAVAVELFTEVEEVTALETAKELAMLELEVVVVTEELLAGGGGLSVAVELAVPPPQEFNTKIAANSSESN